MAASSDSVRGRGRPRSAGAGKAILDATRALLEAGGYEAVTMEGVAARAGVGKTTVYRRYANRAELVIDAVVDVLAAAVPGEDRGSLRADLEAVVEGLTGSLGAPVLTGVLLRLLTEALHDPDTRRAIEERMLARRREVVAALLARATARGELPRPVDPDTVMDLVAGPLLQRLARGGQVDDAFRRQLVDVVVTGLTAPAAAIPRAVTVSAASAPARRRR
jgi:AcrR family transcriptional regulator